MFWAKRTNRRAIYEAVNSVSPRRKMSHVQDAVKKLEFNVATLQSCINVFTEQFMKIIEDVKAVHGTQD